MKRIKQLFNAVVDLLFPRYCVVCKKRLLPQEQQLCLFCLSALNLDTPLSYFSHICIDRLAGRLPFVEIAASFHFKKGEITQTIAHFIKYKDGEKAAIFFGKLAGKILRENNFFKEVDMMIPVPLHPKKLKKRGYNQSELICKGINQAYNIPIETSVLKRSVNTVSQSQQSAISREKNVANAFYCQQSERLENKHILLVDDILTTGATISSCYDALKDIKGIKISIYTLMITAV